MSDIKLFEITNNSVNELLLESVSIEKSLQTLIEQNLEQFLGIRFLASEHITGKTHGGRIDTLGLDENNSPVIIEYKRSLNENVINQGLYYLDWLLDHKAEFELMVLNKLGSGSSQKIDWDTARLLCIAGEFTKYDVHSVQQMNRNIELISYKRFENNLFLLELINATTSSSSEPKRASKKAAPRQANVLSSYEKMDQAHKDRYEALKAFIMNLGDDIQEKTLKWYVAFKRFSNFACVEFHPNAGKMLLFLKVDPKSIVIEEGFSRDVSKIGHLGTGDLEITIDSDIALAKSQELIIRSYQIS